MNNEAYVHDLKIIYLSPNELMPYENNTRKHNPDDIDGIKKSILDVGFADPIAVWGENNLIVEGHGRQIAALELGLDKVPVIRLDHMTVEQRKEYAIRHNRSAEMSDWDFTALEEELADLDINGVDMSDLNFDINLPDDDYYDDEQVRSSLQHNVFENQERMQFPSDNYYGFPNILATNTVGDKFLRFCDWKEISDPENYIAHFYYDDYKFISAWREPEKYIEKLKQFKAVVAPDFSLYTDFPIALQILSCYRRQWCGAYWQNLGIDVIPDVVWGTKESYKFCFDGIPKHSTVAVSTVGVKRDKTWNGETEGLFRDGYNEMLKRLEPTTVLFYGDMIEGLDGNIIKIPSFYEEKRPMLNERVKKKNGERE